MSSGTNDDPAFLDDLWCLYFHDPDDRDWTFGSYKRICTISTAEEFWGVHNSIRSHLDRGMFFIMREHVFPCWDDAMNIEGGCISFMSMKTNLQHEWEDMCAKMLTERLTKEDVPSEIVNGLSISPKNDFCIIKIWLANDVYTESEQFDVPFNTGMFTSNRIKIAGDHRAG